MPGSSGAIRVSPSGVSQRSRHRATIVLEQPRQRFKVGDSIGMAGRWRREIGRALSREARLKLEGRYNSVERKGRSVHGISLVSGGGVISGLQRRLINPAISRLLRNRVIALGDGCSCAVGLPI